MEQSRERAAWERVRTRARTIATALIAVSALFLVPGLVPRAAAATSCVFVTSSATMTLTGDCWTDATIYIPNGFTLDGAGFQITAVNPPVGHFVGAVVQNAGTSAHVRNLGVTTSGLADVCDAGADRLRGIMFDGASGSILRNTLTNINQGLSGCQEGNAIEVRSAPFDGTHPNTKEVAIGHNTITDYQKTGIVANGDVSVEITHNWVGDSSSNKYYIAANSIQIGFGGRGSVNNNHIEGNQWDVVSTPQWSATAVLVFEAGNVNVNHNEIVGDGTDIGVAAYYSGTVNVMNNDISRTVPGGGDVIDIYGIGVDLSGNSGKSKVISNTFSGWNVDYSGEDLAKNNKSP